MATYFTKKHTKILQEIIDFLSSQENMDGVESSSLSEHFSRKGYYLHDIQVAIEMGFDQGCIKTGKGFRLVWSGQLKKN